MSQPPGRWMDPNGAWHEGWPPHGWWQAVDGRWFPPESDLGHVPSAGPLPTRSRPRVGRWRRRITRLAIGLVGLPVVVGVIGAIVDPPVDDPERRSATLASPTSLTSTPSQPVDEVGAPGLPSNSGSLYADRLGAQSNDQETTVGGLGAAYSGWNVYIESAALDGDRLTFEGRLFNRTDDAHSFHSFDWGLQHPTGEIKGSLILPSDASGLVASGGTAPVSLAFNVAGLSSGDWVYLIHSPTDFSDDARGIWGLQIP